MQHPPPPRGKRRNRKGGKGDDAQRKRNTGTRPEVGGEIISPTKLNEKKTDNPVNNLEAELEFEDPYPDELDEEDLKIMQATQEGMEKMEEGEEDEDGDVEFRDPDDEDENLPAPKVWRPGIDKLGDDEVLEYDSSAYDMLHTLNVEWPCLSFDVLIDNLGYERATFPHTLYLVAGTQADRAQNNKIFVFKASQLHRTKNDDKDSDEEDDDDENDLDDDAIVEHKSVSHPGGVNRIRSMPGHPEIVATWSDTKSVFIWNLKEHITSLDEPPTRRLGNVQPTQTFKGHADEGFALDWSRTKEGRLLTGDCSRFIYLWEFNAGASQWAVTPSPYGAHAGSVEDLQWSPNEVEVFASCSVDKTIKVWDARMKERPGLSVQAHNTDVNVISWNRKVPYLMLSGADDGQFSIWDLRAFKSNEPAAHFNWHKAPITSVEWHPTEDSILAVSGADDQVTTWDMSLEKDDAEDAMADNNNGADIPPQLLFVHQGQKDVKEVHWHPQIPEAIISTAGDGFNIYKSSNVGKYL